MASCPRPGWPSPAPSSFRRSRLHLGLFPLPQPVSLTGDCVVVPLMSFTSLHVDLEAQRTGMLLEGGAAPGRLCFSLTR